MLSSSYLVPNPRPPPHPQLLHHFTYASLNLSYSRRQQNSVNLFHNYTILYTYRMYSYSTETSLTRLRQIVHQAVLFKYI
jgi:hypothetical protein